MVLNPRDWEAGGAHRPYSLFKVLDEFTLMEMEHSMDAAPYSLFPFPLSPLEACCTCPGGGKAGGILHMNGCQARPWKDGDNWAP